MDDRSLNKISLSIAVKFPYEFRLDENVGKAFREERNPETPCREFYPGQIKVEDIIYDLDDCRVYASNSWATYRQRIKRININL